MGVGAKTKRRATADATATVYKIELRIEEGSRTIGVSVFKNGARYGPGYASNSMAGALSYLRGVLVW